MSPLFLALVLAQRPKPLADLPFVHERGRVWLKAHLNGKPVDAMLDTGAEVCIADADAANATGVRGERIGSANGMGSKAIDTWATTGLTLTLDGCDAAQAVLYASDLSRMVGKGGHRPNALLGGDFLKRFVVEIDYPGSRVRLYDPKDYAPSEGTRRLALRFDTGRPVVDLPMRLPGGDEETVSALLDTGSIGISVTGEYIRRGHLLERFPDAKPYDGMGGIAGATPGRLLPGIVGFFGGMVFSGAVFLDLSKKGLTGPDVAYDTLAGDDLFANRLMTFDYGRSTLYLSPPTP